MASENNTKPNGSSSSDKPKLLQLPEPQDLMVSFGTDAPKIDFVLPGFAAGTVGGLVSPGGVGKSWMSLLCAVSIAGPQELPDLLGIGIEGRGRVVYFAGEDPREIIHQRLRAIAQVKREITQEVQDHIKENLTIYPTIGYQMALDDATWEAKLTEMLEGCRLAIFDTLTRFHSLDENKTDDAKKVMGAMERIAAKTGCTILYLHHVSKASALGGLTELQQAARGSGVFVDNARWLSFISGMSPEEAKKYEIKDEDRKDFVRWNISKQNYSAGRNDAWFLKSDGGILLPIVIEAVAARLYGTAYKKAKRGGF